MKNKQLIVRSAVTMVATGLSLLVSDNSQASGRGSSGMRPGSGRGGMTNGAMHQSIGNHGMNRVATASNAIGHNRSEHRPMTQVNKRDDHGGRRGHREPGDDRGGMRQMSRGERQPGDDRGGRREGERRHGKDDGRGHDLRDDKGGRGEREQRHGRDDGKRHDLRDDKGGHGEREHRHGEREPGDDRGQF